MIIFIAVLFAIGFWFVITFNNFIREKNLINEAWSGIDVQLKRRFDLIPNIVETVKCYAQHEKKIFEEVAALRTSSYGFAGARERGEAENGITRGLKSLFAVAEAYPELKANQNFLALQKTLSEIEDEIQLARRYYNGTVRNYNIRVESFPSMVIGKLCNFQPKEYFEIELATQRETPAVAM